jgi:hypothetical protein
MAFKASALASIASGVATSKSLQARSSSASRMEDICILHLKRFGYEPAADGGGISRIATGLILRCYRLYLSLTGRAFGTHRTRQAAECRREIDPVVAPSATTGALTATALFLSFLDARGACCAEPR